MCSASEFADFSKKDSKKRDDRTGKENEWDKDKDDQEDSQKRKFEAKDVKQCRTEFIAAFKRGITDGQGKELHTVVTSATVGEGEKLTKIHTVMVGLKAFL